MFDELFFLISASLTVISAILVLVTKNIMHACVFLLGSLIGIAGLYVTLGADFVAATQMMVYVGGVVILMVFAVMLTGGKDFQSKAQKLLGLIPTMGNMWTLSLAIFTALVFCLSIIKLIGNILTTAKITDTGIYTSTVEKIGTSLVTDHVLAFELSSVLLLGALVGAAIIARPRKGK